MAVQAHLPPALAAVHNFIRKHDSDDLADYKNIQKDPQPGAHVEGAARMGLLATGLPRVAERREANTRRDGIAEEM